MFFPVKIFVYKKEAAIFFTSVWRKNKTYTHILERTATSQLTCTRLVSGRCCSEHEPGWQTTDDAGEILLLRMVVSVLMLMIIRSRKRGRAAQDDSTTEEDSAHPAAPQQQL